MRFVLQWTKKYHLGPCNDFIDKHRVGVGDPNVGPDLSCKSKPGFKMRA